jgi:hypothetical protein
VESSLVRLSKWDGSVFKRSTLYKFKHLGKYPRLFVKIGGAVFIDTAVLSEIVEAGRIN